MFGLAKVIVVLFFLVPFNSYADDNFLASGDGFKVSPEYLASLQNYYAKSGMATDSDQYLEQAVFIKVLAEEARRLELAESEAVEADSSKDESAEYKKFITDYALASSYIAHFIESKNVDDQVIKSYYRSNYTKFYDGPWEGAEVLPLDESLKSVIRSEILRAAREKIIKNLKQDLMAKYNVQVY